MRHPRHVPGACRSSGRPRPTDLLGRAPAGGNDRPVTRLPVLEPPHPEDPPSSTADYRATYPTEHNCLATGKSQDLSPTSPK